MLARTDELNQAFLHADIATLERIIADDCVQITQNGSRSKSEWLAPYRSGASRFESINPPEWRHIRLYGDVAVVTSAAEIAMVVQGERRPSRFFNTRTWAKRSGQWYLVLAQNTARQEPAPAPTGANNPSVPGGTTDDEAAIRKIVADSADAWNRRDAKGVVAHFSEDIDHIGVQGLWRSSRAELEKSFTAGSPTVRNDQSTTVERIRFLTPDVAVVVVRRKYVGEFRNSPGPQETREAISTSVFHKMNGGWWVEAFQNTLVQSREEAIAQAARASGPMAQTEPEVITPPNSKTDFSGDVAAIRKRAADAVDAWNRRDPKAETAHASENHDHINVIGAWRQGKAETDKAMTAALASTRNNVSSSIAKIRFITSDVAIVIVRYQYTNDKEALKSISTSVLHKISGEWWNEAFQNTFVQPR